MNKYGKSVIDMGRIFLILIGILIFTTSMVEAAKVINESVRQVGNRVVFEFDIEGTEKETDVTLTLTIDGKKYTEKDLHLEGDYGKVKVGKGKRIYWNVLQDFPRGLHTEFEWELRAGPDVPENFVFVKGGCFKMGDLWGDGRADERPVHEVCVDDFYISKYEVTVGEFREFVEDTGYVTEAERKDECWGWTGKGWKKSRDLYWNNSGFSQTDRHPVVCVSWNDAQAFIEWKRDKMGMDFRLPTEAEWEYAARSGGKREKWAGTNSRAELYRYANFCDSSCDLKWKTSNQDDGYRFTAPVGSFKPNGLGLYDMSGNVYEWVEDWYDKDYYKRSPRDNPRGPDSGSDRVHRGGSWFDFPSVLRSYYRSHDTPSDSNNFMGFRLVVGAAVTSTREVKSYGNDSLYREAYSTDFSTNPHWVTNNSTNYYWNKADGTFHIKQVNVNNGGYYAYYDVRHNGGSFKLEWDIMITSNDYASDVGFGIFDKDLDTQSDSYVRIWFTKEDRGNIIYFAAHGLKGIKGVDSYPTKFALDTWYHIVITYDDSAGTLQAIITERDTGVILTTLTLTNAGPFASDMGLIGSSNRRIGKDFQIPDARSTGKIDNVRFFVPRR